MSHEYNHIDAYAERWDSDFNVDKVLNDLEEREAGKRRLKGWAWVLASVAALLLIGFTVGWMVSGAVGAFAGCVKVWLTERREMRRRR